MRQRVEGRGGNHCLIRLLPFTILARNRKGMCLPGTQKTELQKRDRRGLACGAARSKVSGRTRGMEDQAFKTRWTRMPLLVPPLQAQDCARNREDGLRGGWLGEHRPTCALLAHTGLGAVATPGWRAAGPAAASRDSTQTGHPWLPASASDDG